MLSQSERDQLGAMLAKLAMFYETNNVDKPRISLYLDTLDEFYGESFETYVKALRLYQSDSKKRIFPSPSALREYITPQAEPIDEANECVSRVFEAIAKFGWPNPDAAEKYMGPVAWSVVQSHGGWMNICENLGVTIPESVFRAQGRDLALSRINNGRRGVSNLIEIGSNDLLTKIGMKTKEIEP